MNQDELQNLKKYIIQIMAYYRQQINHEVVSMYSADLSDLVYENVIDAYQKYRKDPKNKFAPLPAQIREIIMGPSETSDLAIARDVASRITKAIPDFGWPNPDKAYAYVGEIGWAVVLRIGGWRYLCENFGTSLDPNLTQAQMRDIALALIEQNNRGQLETPPSFEKYSRDQLPQPMQKLLASMDKDFPQ